MLVPEWVLYCAFRQLWEARMILRKLAEINYGENASVKENGGVDEEAKIEGGGSQDEGKTSQIVLEEVGPKPAVIEPAEQSQQVSASLTAPSRAQRAWKYFFPDQLELGFFLCMGGIEVVDKSNPTARRQLTPQGVIVLARAGLLPQIDIDETNDKGKSDGLARLIVRIQAGWMIVEAVTRKTIGLPQTLLEIHTITHVICALGLYLFWFKKPQGVLVTSIEIDAIAIALLIEKPEDFGKGESDNLITWDEFITINYDTGKGSLVDKTDLVFLDITRGELINILFVFPFCGIYGAIHLLPWNGHFPTNFERIMWRGSGLIIFVSPCLLLFFRVAIRPVIRPLLHANGLTDRNSPNFFTRRRMSSKLEDERAKKRWVVLALEMYAFVSLWLILPCLYVFYFGARVFIVVESFASLRSLPEGTHQSARWLSMIPHF